MTTLKRSAFWQSLKNRPRLSAVLELLFFIAIFFLFDFFSVDQNRYWNSAPHPFWIIILLISVQYGANEGLVAVVFCTIALLAWNLPAHSINENIYDYLLQVSQRPIKWTITTVIIGEMTSRLKLTIYELEDRLDRVLAREESITKAYKNLKGIKEQMETRLVGQLRSSIDSFSAVRSIDSLNPVHLLKNIGEMIRSITGPDQISVYLLTQTGFELVDHHGWENDTAYARHFAADSPLFQQIATDHRVLCVTNAADAVILEQEGVMAGPLIDPVSNMLFGMVKIERLDFMQLTETNIDTFKIMLEWAGATFTQARQYQKAYGNLMHNPKSGMLSSNFYKYFRTYLGKVAALHPKQKFFQVDLFLIAPPGADSTQKLQFARALVQFAKEILPSDILLFTVKMNHSHFAVIPLVSGARKINVLAAQIQEFIDLQAKHYPDLKIKLKSGPL